MRLSFYSCNGYIGSIELERWRWNILRDAGTYSYNCQKPWQDYFKSLAAHNTIRFDDHEQMPKISRFLNGKWPRLTVEADLSEGAYSISEGLTVVITVYEPDPEKDMITNGESNNMCYL